MSNNFERMPLLIAALLSAGSVSVALAQTPRPATPIQVPTEEQLAEYPRMTGFRLSPDGKHLLAIESKGNVRTILVWKTANLADKPTVLGSNNMRIGSAAFLKNDMLSVTLSQPYDARVEGTLTKTFLTKLAITDLEGKVWKEPLESADMARGELARRIRAQALPTIKSRVLSDADHVVVESDGFGNDRDLFRYNVRTGAASRVLRMGENDINVIVDAAGRPRSRTKGGTDSKGTFVSTEIRNATSGDWEEHFRSYVKERDIDEILRVGIAPNTFVLRSNVGRETAALYEYDAVQKKKVGVLFEHRFFDASNVKIGGSADESDAATYDGFSYLGPQGDEVHWANPKLESVVKGMAQALGIPEATMVLVDVKSGARAEVKALDGVSISVEDFRDGASPVYLIKVTGLTYPTEHYFLRGQQLTLLAKERPQIDRRALGQAKFTYYKARDGLNIPAILTTPNRELCGAGPYATVIHPHGGPWARDDMAFDDSAWVPLLVSRCHAVLQPQFRGSYNWGRSLWMAGDAEWGQKMQDDKDDGAKWLIDEKIADAKRIAMFGFSYGGYSAMAASVRPQGLYKCAIAGAGVSDIERIWAAFYTNPFFRDRQEPTVRGLSPLKQADKIKIPIMVYHGERDQIVPLIQSELFVDKAKGSGQKVDYHVLADYAHGPAWTREIMTQQLKLISSYLKTGCGGSGL